MPDASNLEILSASDTIAAIATAPGVGAIGIVRLSGPDALAVAGACFRSRYPEIERIPHHQLTYGQWVHPETGEVLDEVFLSVMPAPKSYTREDVVEVYGHGGPLVLRQVLAAALAQGARPARPGEFTLRAFRSGRVDLLQAEAVGELVQAETESARRLALRALRGGLSERVSEMKHTVVELLTHLETHLEFPMEDVRAMPQEELLGGAKRLRNEVEELLRMARRREFYRRGLYTVITGRPNVGKSLLFNRLLGRERALVTASPGTTRDTLEETIRVGGLELLLVDTAGGREGLQEAEILGVGRTAEAARRADLLWFLVDAQDGVTQDDEQWLERILVERSDTPAPLLLLINKVDLVRERPKLESSLVQATFPPEKQFWISARTGEGIEPFLVALQGLCERECQAAIASDLLVNQRQERALREILLSLGRTDEAAKAGLSLDVIATDLWDVKNSLDELDGTRTSADLLGEIFSRFCIGK